MQRRRGARALGLERRREAAVLEAQQREGVALETDLGDGIDRDRPRTRDARNGQMSLLAV